MKDRMEGKEEERGMTSIKRYIQKYTTVMYNTIFTRKLVSANNNLFPLSVYRTACPASQTSASVGF